MTCSLQRLLIILGLVIVPFYELFLKALPFVRNMSPDSRAPKEFIALAFALSIGLLAVFQGTLKPFRNKYLLIIPLYLVFNLFMAPHADLFINKVEIGDFYFWKPFSEVLCFTLMIIAVASIDIDLKDILRVMVVCGTIMSIYVILQKLGFDQFWVVKDHPDWTPLIKGAELGGNLGQKTIVASFIVMIIPLSMYLKKYWMTVVMVIACLLTKGLMVISALVLMTIITIFYFYGELRNIIIMLLLISGVLILFYKPMQEKIIEKMDGRYAVWEKTIHDIHHGQIKDGINYSITGIGLGRFPFVFPLKNKSEFQQTHNDILEFIYDCGIAGGFLLLGGIYLTISGALINLSPLCFSILLSFIAIIFYSLGSFPFQLAVHQFYSAVLIGLLHNDRIIRRG